MRPIQGKPLLPPVIRTDPDLGRQLIGPGDRRVVIVRRVAGGFLVADCLEGGRPVFGKLRKITTLERDNYSSL